ILGVDRSADGAQIKKAYRQLALKYHPDRNKDDTQAEALFKEASEAYEVLSDPEKRKVYDMYGHQGLHGTGFQGFSGVDDVFSSFGDLFEEFFGGFGGNTRSRQGGGRARAYAGSDLKHDISIAFREAAKGIEKPISVTKEVNCDVCKGSGAEPGSSRVNCSTCGGSGNISHRQGFFVLQSTCPHCRGQGSRLEKACSECRGAGRVRQTKKLSVKIPAGIDDGMQLVLRGEGAEGIGGGPSGDLYVEVHVEKDDVFERHEDDLYCKIPISFPQAALGDTIEVPTLNGPAKVKVPAGTETGDQVRMPEHGLPSVHKRRGQGDLIVQFQVKTPKKLSKRQKQLIEALMNEG
ncbi:MAG: molecular chaperone DnaJ, partial [Deltaproteobacteria bacterium]|nr:molecular chaperone DnaJ [Deltaproteobacteria bacterium]